MKIQLFRLIYTDESTIGALFINGFFECYTLEDTVREQEGIPVEQWKVFGQTAIPRGKYEVEYYDSHHFGRFLPHIKNVQGFEGVLIHSGNKPEDTEGCILLGTTHSKPDWVDNSRGAFDKFFVKFKDAVNNKETITITIH
jgi:hypothetical protein